MSLALVTVEVVLIHWQCALLKWHVRNKLPLLTYVWNNILNINLWKAAYEISVTACWLTNAPFISLNTTPLNIRGESASVGFSFSSLHPSCLKKRKNIDVKIFFLCWRDQRQNHGGVNFRLTWSPALLNKERKLHPDRLIQDSGSPSHFVLRMDTWYSHWLFKHKKHARKLINITDLLFWSKQLNNDK